MSFRGRASTVNWMRWSREAGTLGARLFAVLSGILTSAITARVLGPEDRGLYFYVVALATTLAGLINFGAPSANAFYAAKHPSLGGRLANWSLALALGAGVVAPALFLLGIRFFDHARFAPSGSAWLLVLTPAILALALMGPVLAGLHKFHTLNLLQVLQQVVTILAFAWVAWTRPSVTGFLIASACSTVAAATIQTFFARRELDVGDREVTLSQWLRYGMRAYLVLVLGALLSRVGVFFVRGSAGGEELGYYSIALQGWDALAILPSALGTVLFPAIVREGRLSWPDCVRETQRMLLLATAIATFAALAMRPAIILIFGGEFEPSTWAALAFLPGFIAYASVVTSSQYLAGLGFPRAVARNWAAATALLIVLCATLTPRWGAVGAAVSTSISYSLLAAIMLLSARREMSRTMESK